MILKLWDGSTAHIALCGPTLTIEVDGKTYPFECDSMGCPEPLNKRGDPKTLGPRHRFWHAVSCWAQQGRNVEQGVAQWTEPPDELEGCVRFGRDWFPLATAERLFPGRIPDETRARTSTPPRKQT